MSEAPKPRIGDVVEYLGRNAHENLIAFANSHLTVGQRYVVNNIFADQWGIYLYFEGVPGKSYRSEMFAYIKNKFEEKEGAAQ